ncbi:hypothetical protein CL622_02050 [archaeon]|nr:hypothetical protein [archaeon]|tara:strand:+ start:1437 stop:1670 length:234 start_codon:yes stop_codon:yes gene_type:complete
MTYIDPFELPEDEKARTPNHSNKEETQDMKDLLETRRVHKFQTWLKEYREQDPTRRFRFGFGSEPNPIWIWFNIKER